MAIPEPLKVQLGDTDTPRFKFTPPSGMSASVIPVYSGNVLIKSSVGEELSIPYFSVGADVKKAIPNVFDYNARIPFIYLGAGHIKTPQKTRFDFNFSRKGHDLPPLTAKLAFGTSELRWDIYGPEHREEADWAHPPVVGERHYVGATTTFTRSRLASWFDPERYGDNNTFAFPLYDQPHHSHVLSCGSFASPTAPASPPSAPSATLVAPPTGTSGTRPSPPPCPLRKMNAPGRLIRTGAASE